MGFFENITNAIFPKDDEEDLASTRDSAAQELTGLFGAAPPGTSQPFGLTQQAQTQQVVSRGPHAASVPQPPTRMQGLMNQWGPTLEMEAYQNAFDAYQTKYATQPEKLRDVYKIVTSPRTGEKVVDPVTGEPMTELERFYREEYLPEREQGMKQARLSNLLNNVQETFRETFGFMPDMKTFEWARGTFFDKDNWTYEGSTEMQAWYRGSEQYKEKFPGIPTDMSTDEYDKLRQKADEVWINHYGRPLGNEELVTLFSGGELDRPPITQGLGYQKSAMLIASEERIAMAKARAEAEKDPLAPSVGSVLSKGRTIFG